MIERTHYGDILVRFMMLMIPGGYASAAPNAMPSAEAVAAMMKYNEELKRPACCWLWTGCIRLPRARG